MLVISFVFIKEYHILTRLTCTEKTLLLSYLPTEFVRNLTESYLNRKSSKVALPGWFGCASVLVVCAMLRVHYVACKLHHFHIATKGSFY